MRRPGRRGGSAAVAAAAAGVVMMAAGVAVGAFFSFFSGKSEPRRPHAGQASAHAV
jgi:hypothetical protein